MFYYILKRTMIGLLTLFAILVFVFAFARVTGNPIEVMYPEGLEPGQMELYNAKYGLDRNIAEQFIIYIKNMIQGNYGQSIIDRRPVTEVIFSRAGETIKLGVGAFAISIVFGVSLGVFTAVKKGTFVAELANHIMAALYAVPGFIIAIFLMLLFSFYLHLLPSQGGGTAKHYIMPVICLSIGPIISIARYIKNGIAETITQDYIRTAVAKGIGKRNTIYRHALRNALIPTLTQIGMVIVDIISGSVVIESVFSWPGIGLTLVSSVLGRDFPVIQFSVVLLSLVVIIVNYIIDILLMIVDPRIGKGET